ncbi:hypothetical protein HMPREF0591_6245 [Mycobacterium parascrofulaceum ATCC BAA-614]|uniref:Uncharacterized protein n=1 Tax=Mycobacterium parascrofulaceum ATCC BAA-614 TaxID=525368 RepID=D5PJA1_9MYCO|nr:hypothetical protein HMPREF0591_6245 [Mycobacterium parascrofulaceum ATCC BAA-614]
MTAQNSPSAAAIAMADRHRRVPWAYPTVTVARIYNTRLGRQAV